MPIDSEITSMSTCHESLSSLEKDAQIRVISWLSDKLGINSNFKSHSFSNLDEVLIQPTLSDQTGEQSSNMLTKKTIKDYNSVTDLFAALDLKTDADKALVVASFLQEKNNLSDFTSFEVQKELKNLGHGVSNITSTMGILEGKKPKLVMQTKKEGKSKQAKKRYKVTVEGIKIANQMLIN